MNKKQKGLAHIGLVLVFVAVVTVGASGWFVWARNHEARSVSTQANEAPPSNTRKSKAPPVENSVATPTASRVLKLANNRIAITTPSSWSANGEGCTKEASSLDGQIYLDSVALIPGEKLPTVYGNGTEYFDIAVCVFENPKNLTPQVWFSDASAGGIGQGIASGNDEESSEPINGNPAYYMKQFASPYPHIETVFYTIAAKGKIIYISAPLYETNPASPGVGDFRKFEPAIRSLVESIRFN